MPKQIELQNIALKSIEFNAEQPLVHGVSLTLKRGRVLALVGSSGSGKSLTCAAALGVLPAGVHQTSGQVLVNGNVTDPSALRGSTIATILQNPRSAFNPVHNMATHAKETCLALGKSADDAHIIAAMKAVGLDDAERILSLYPFEMSGGMLQRMMIALAVLCDAPFIVADEPTTDLDAVAQAKILDLLEQFMQKPSSDENPAPGMLLVTHDMGVVARLADDVIVMDQGKIVEQGEVESIFNAPKHKITRNLVAAHLALYGLELETNEQSDDSATCDLELAS
ncbi:MAG: nickel import ATP-binding protein NikD [Vibrio sp.]